MGAGAPRRARLHRRADIDPADVTVAFYGDVFQPARRRRADRPRAGRDRGAHGITDAAEALAGDTGLDGLMKALGREQVARTIAQLGRYFDDDAVRAEVRSRASPRQLPRRPRVVVAHSSDVFAGVVERRVDNGPPRPRSRAVPVRPGDGSRRCRGAGGAVTPAKSARCASTQPTSAGPGSSGRPCSVPRWRYAPTGRRDPRRAARPVDRPRAGAQGRQEPGAPRPPRPVDRALVALGATEIDDQDGFRVLATRRATAVPVPRRPAQRGPGRAVRPVRRQRPPEHTAAWWPVLLGGTVGPVPTARRAGSMAAPAWSLTMKFVRVFDERVVKNRMHWDVETDDVGRLLAAARRSRHPTGRSAGPCSATSTPTCSAPSNASTAEHPPSGSAFWTDDGASVGVDRRRRRPGQAVQPRGAGRPPCHRLRRSGCSRHDDDLSCADLTVDDDAHLVTRSDVEIDLTPTEYSLLCHLLANGSCPVEDPVGGGGVGLRLRRRRPGGRDVHPLLRNKVDTTDHPDPHDRGVGYCLRPPR